MSDILRHYALKGSYWNYKTFNGQLFRIELGKELTKTYLNNDELAEFQGKSRLL